MNPNVASKGETPKLLTGGEEVVDIKSQEVKGGGLAKSHLFVLSFPSLNWREILSQPISSLDC